MHRKSSRSAFFSAIFYDLRSLHSGTCLNTKSPRAFRWKRAFCTWIPSSLLSGYTLNRQTGHGRGRNLGTRLIFSPPRVVRSSNVQYLPHLHRDTSHWSIVLINQADSEVKLKQMDKGQNLNILRDLLWALKLGLFSLNCYRRGRDALKLTEKWIGRKACIKKRTNCQVRTHDKYLGIIAFRKFDVGIRNLISIID